MNIHCRRRRRRRVQYNKKFFFIHWQRRSEQREKDKKKSFNNFFRPSSSPPRRTFGVSILSSTMGVNSIFNAILYTCTFFPSVYNFFFFSFLPFFLSPNSILLFNFSDRIIFESESLYFSRLNYLHST